MKVSYLPRRQRRLQTSPGNSPQADLPSPKKTDEDDEDMDKDNERDRETDKEKDKEKDPTGMTFCGHGESRKHLYCQSCMAVLCPNCLRESVTSGRCGRALGHSKIRLEKLGRHLEEALRWSEMTAGARLEVLRKDGKELEVLRRGLDRSKEKALCSVQEMHRYCVKVLDGRRSEMAAYIERAHKVKVDLFEEEKQRLAETAEELAKAKDEAAAMATQPRELSSYLIRRFALVGAVDSLASYKPNLEGLRCVADGLNFYSHRETAREVLRRAFGFIGPLRAIDVYCDGDEKEEEEEDEEEDEKGKGKKEEEEEEEETDG